MSARDPDRFGPPPVPGARTEEERERARLEREARRGRGGRGGSRGRAEPKGPPPERPRLTFPGRGGQPSRPGPGAEAGNGGSPDADDREGPLERLRALRGSRAGDEQGRPGADAPPGRGRRRSVRRLALAAGLVVGVVLVLYAVAGSLGGGGGERVRVVIPPDTGAAGIADILDRRGVISSPFLFRLRATVTGDGGSLKPGTYTLRTGMGAGAAIDALAAGPPRNVVSVTVPEGRSRREIAPLVRRAGLEGSYLKATDSARDFPLRRYGARGAENLEGFLFPATYEMSPKASAGDLVEKQLTAFRDAFEDVDLRAARRRQLTPYDVLIVASMVEREAQLDRERPLIASVIYNRLREGQPLGIDATIRFATNNWSRPLTESQLAVDSPYNTRTNQGLPPGPIGNPGLDSIRAAANPRDTDFLFYVVKPGTCGEHAFSKTLEQFEQDRQRYNAERERRGGRSPVDC